jgi:hypothetical protein
MTVPLNNNYPIVDEKGFMQQPLRLWVDEISELSILEGTGSPEGVVEANVSRLYRDITGTTGDILYIKNAVDILGDKSKGWILV